MLYDTRTMTVMGASISVSKKQTVRSDWWGPGGLPPVGRTFP